MCLAQVVAWDSVTRTSGTSSTAGAHASFVGSMGPARGCGLAGGEELFSAGSLPGADDSTGRSLRESNFFLFRAIGAKDTKG